MELTKKSIEGIRFTLVRRKFYYSAEVDEALDQLAELADRNQKELDKLRQRVQTEVDSQHEKDQQEIADLKKRVETLQRAANETHAMDSAAVIAQANQKARDILQQAMRESENILADITGQRNRVIAASRTAYYNALQFKQEVAQQYRQLEQDMDSAIDVLRVLEGTQGSAIGGSTPVSIYGGEPAEKRPS